MIIPTLQGVIERRMLINFAADPAVIQNILPKPFRPQLAGDKAIAGICLIRLKSVRLKGLPAFVGLSSENSAHRIAVEWDSKEGIQRGVYIPRRDTSSWLNAFAGNRFFPGDHYRAAFDVKEANGQYKIALNSADGICIRIDASICAYMEKNSVFRDLESASLFFKNGSIGYSPKQNGFEGIQLKTHSWQVQPLKVTEVYSSYFQNERIFPKGSIAFDNALLMTNIEHEWAPVESKMQCL